MKIAFLFSVAAVALVSSPLCAGFLSLPFVAQANPAVTQYADAQASTLLNIRLDIEVTRDHRGAPTVSGGRLGVDGLLVELHGGKDANYEHPNLPGADGPQHSRQLSSGAKSLSIVRPGGFVDLSGSRIVGLEHGAWEMIWRKNAKAGALVCGFDVPEEVTRNAASIPAGRLYLTFPVWTQESLQHLRERKEKAGERAAEAMDRLAEEKRLMEDTPNLLLKALHFRNACKAAEDFDYSGHRQYQAMPLERDMIALKGDLHLCSLGTVWTKGGKGLFGADHVLLGSASASAGERGTLTDKKVLAQRELLLLRP